MNKTSKNSSGAASLKSRAVMGLFPKIELHRHLEGTFDIPTLFAISKRNGIDAPRTYDDFLKSVQFPSDSPPDFLTFLSKFRNDWYRTHQDIAELVYQSVLNLAKEKIHYIELRFSPEHFCLQNNFDRMEITRLIIANANRAAREGKFILKYLITFNRHKQTAAEMLQLYTDLRGLKLPEIVGIDLAGDELNFPPELFEKFFQQVRKDGIYGITIHAGEVTPPQKIWDAMNILHANRIGHGTTSISDEKLQKALTERKVTLEQCITSNYQTGSWTDPGTHPFGRLFRLGVPVSINTDDPHIQNCDLTDEYIKVAEYFDFTLDDFIHANHLAIDGAFLSDKEKEELRQSYDQAVAEFRKSHPEL